MREQAKAGHVRYPLESLIPDTELTAFYCMQAAAMAGVSWNEVFYEWTWANVWRVIGLSIAARKQQ